MLIGPQFSENFSNMGRDKTALSFSDSTTRGNLPPNLISIMVLSLCPREMKIESTILGSCTEEHVSC